MLENITNPFILPGFEDIHYIIDDVMTLFLLSFNFSLYFWKNFLLLKFYISNSQSNSISYFQHSWLSSWFLLWRYDKLKHAAQTKNCLLRKWHSTHLEGSRAITPLLFEVISAFFYYSLLYQFILGLNYPLIVIYVRFKFESSLTLFELVFGLMEIITFHRKSFLKIFSI